MSRRPAAIDMSPEAVSSRLEEVRSLYALAMSLARARVVGPLREHRGRPEVPSPPGRAVGGGEWRRP
ncbi:MAG: hypothetical protein HY744_10810 [Deltaproteobacteria bacterium]|nr:hypothetical protein [Deltaproteobacteria bacterium]